MIGDPKKVAIHIISKVPPEGEEGPGPAMDGQDEDHENGALHAISQELIHAVHAGDAGGVAEALQAAYDCCGSESSDEE